MTQSTEGENRKPAQGRKAKRRIYQSLAQILQFSLYMLVPICGMSALGYFLDRHFGTSWIFIVCFFVGAIAGFQNVYRFAMEIMRGGRKGPEKPEDPADEREKR
ncbi:MAG: AtpZ/AtpI family protein [Lachnospiraceae bacterium]|nr:AtpZ/AtpI family protein [Lachnospiraceae bacterium]